MEYCKLIQENKVVSICTDVAGCIRNTIKFEKIAKQYLQKLILNQFLVQYNVHHCSFNQFYYLLTISIS